MGPSYALDLLYLIVLGLFHLINPFDTGSKLLNGVKLPWWGTL